MLFISYLDQIKSFENITLFEQQANIIYQTLSKIKFYLLTKMLKKLLIQNA